MRIIRLEAENVKRLFAVEIRPDGAAIIVGGRNDSGKTSALDAIMYVLGGAGTHPPKPVREGEKKAKIRLDLGEEEVELVVKKTISSGGSVQLVVETPDGVPKRSPQTVLDALVGAISFDPSEFARMKPKEQMETLKGLVGLDFTGLDKERVTIYDDRRTIGVKAKDAAAVAKDLGFFPDAPKEPVSVDELMDEMSKKEGVNAGHEDRRRELANLADRENELGKELSNWEASVLRLEQELQNAKQNRAAVAKSMTDIHEKIIAEKAAIAELKDEDIEEVREKIRAAQGINAEIAANVKRQEANQVAEKLTEEYKGITDRIERIDAEKRDAIEAAQFPIEGLGFDEDGVTFGGIPFVQASQSERWRTSIAIGAAINPTLRVMLIREGALLDDDRLKEVVKMAEENDLQLWIEDVGEDRASVVIEDGRVKA